MGIFDIFKSTKPEQKKYKYQGSPLTVIKSQAETGMMRSALSSPDQTGVRTLGKTRRLSRYMCANDAFASKYLELTRVYICGDDGITLNPVVQNKTGTRNEKVAKAIHVEWKRWGEEASLNGKMTWAEMEGQAIKAIARDGEVFYRMVVGKTINEYAYALQQIDPILIDPEYNMSLPNGNIIVAGIEFDKRGRVKAYHVWNRALDSSTSSIIRKRSRIKADEMVHIFDDSTGSSVRGIPWTVPALDQLIRLREWQDDYAAGMKLAARTRLVLHNEVGDEELLDDIEDDIVGTDGSSRSVNIADTDFVNTSQSQIIEVDAGKKLEALNLQLPTSGVSESAKLILQRIAAGLLVSYTTLTADGSKSSFSSVRHDSIIERDIWRYRQRWFISKFHKVVFKSWLDKAILTGHVTLPAGIPQESVGSEWLPRGFSQIDAVKDGKAYIQGIESGLYSRSQVAAMMGSDFNEIVNQIAADNELLESLGIDLSSKKDVEPEINVTVVPEN